MNTLPRSVLALSLILVVGCSTTPPTRPSSSEPAPIPAADSGANASMPEQNETPSQPGASPEVRPSPDDATLALLNQSERAAASGAMADAVSYAERAVRIDPRRADLWTRLAELELKSDDPDTAIRYAQKALSLTAGRTDLARDAWLVIADAKDALGAAEEAADIRRRWQTARG